MRKINRVYQLKVEVGGNAYTTPLRSVQEFGRSSTPVNAHVTITLPTALQFEICRQTLSSAQTGTFRLFNLAPEIRDAIHRDIYDVGTLRAVQLWAGYSNETSHQVPLVFNGTILTALSWREREDWITEIQAYDGGFQQVNGNDIALTQGPNLSASEAIRMLAKNLPGMTGNPIVGDFPGTNKRGEVFFGNIWALIQKKSNGLACIDNGQVKAMNYSEVLEGGLPVIDDSTGLIGTPRISGVAMDLDMVFEPALTICQIVRLNVASMPKLSRAWKVLGFDHAGTITTYGDAGPATTRVRLWYTEQSLTVIPGNPVLLPITL